MADKYSDKYVEQFLNTYVFPAFTNPRDGYIRNSWKYAGGKGYDAGMFVLGESALYAKQAMNELNSNGKLSASTKQGVINAFSKTDEQSVYEYQKYLGINSYDSAVKSWVDTDTETERMEAELEAQRQALEEQKKAAEEEAKRQAEELAKQQQLAQEAAAREAANQPNRSAGNVQRTSLAEAAEVIYGNKAQKKRRVGYGDTQATEGGNLGNPNVVRKQLLGM